MQPDNVISASQNQVWSDLGGDVAILQVKSGTYYGLDAVGARIWQLIQQPLTVAEVTAVIQAEYDVDPERCTRDVEALLCKLNDAGLIQVGDESVG